MISTDDRARLAKALADAEQTRTAIEPLTKDEPSLDIVDAYGIQLLNIVRRVEHGTKVVGHKVGLSARAMQQMFGVDEPDYGHLLDDMFVAESTTVRTGELLQPRVEVEVAFVLGAVLPAPGCTVMPDGLSTTAM